jgi:lysyl-tRNA synthetase class II
MEGKEEKKQVATEAPAPKEQAAPAPPAVQPAVPKPVEEVKERPLPPIPLVQTPATSFSGRVRIRYLFEHSTEFIDKVIYVAGWARTLRFTKKVAFAEMTDGSGPQGLQIVMDKGLSNYAELEKMRAGCSLGFMGKVVKSPGSKQSIEMQVQADPAHYAKIYGDCPADSYPLAKKEHTVEVSS